MAEVPSFVSTEFDIFARKPRQIAVEGTTETIYKPIASIDQTDIDFFIPGNSETYIDLDLKLLIKGKLMKEDNTQLTDTGYTAGINNLLHSLQSLHHLFKRHPNYRPPNYTITEPIWKHS